MKTLHAAMLALIMLAIGIMLGRVWASRIMTAEHIQELDATNSLLTDTEIRVYAEHGRLGDLHDLVDTDTEWQLYKVKPVLGGSSKESDDTKIKILYFVAKSWEKHPPDFGVLAFEQQRNSDHVFFDNLIKMAKDMQARDMATLHWAETQCAQRPDLDCKPMKADTADQPTEPALVNGIDPLEDFALANALNSVAELHFLGKGKAMDVQDLLNSDIESDLNHITPALPFGWSDANKAAKIRTLVTVGHLWQQHPPFTGDDYKPTAKNQFWIKEFQMQHARNMAMLRWAEAICVHRPDIGCKPYITNGSDEKVKAPTGSN